MLVPVLPVKGTSCPSDSLRSPLTTRPETKTWLVVGEAEGSGCLESSAQPSGSVSVAELFRLAFAVSYSAAQRDFSQTDCRIVLA